MLIKKSSVAPRARHPSLSDDDDDIKRQPAQVSHSRRLLGLCAHCRNPWCDHIGGVCHPLEPLSFEGLTCRCVAAWQQGAPASHFLVVGNCDKKVTHLKYSEQESKKVTIGDGK